MNRVLHQFEHQIVKLFMAVCDLSAGTFSCKIRIYLQNISRLFFTIFSHTLPNNAEHYFSVLFSFLVQVINKDNTKTTQKHKNRKYFSSKFLREKFLQTLEIQCAFIPLIDILSMDHCNQMTSIVITRFKKFESFSNYAKIERGTFTSDPRLGI